MSKINGYKKLIKLKHIIIFILILSAYLSLKNLDAAYFWDDEAQTGIIARNFLNTGTLTGWDGRNLLALRSGTLLDENLCIINPPLSFWVCAASFKIFGISMWAGRFPFVLAGLASLIVVMLLLKVCFGEDKWLWFYALGMLAASPVFLLNIRQCRYYAVTMLFSLLTFYFYQLCLIKKRFYYFLLLSLSAVLLFYSNFLLCITFLFSLIVYHFLFHRSDFHTKEWRNMVISMGIFLVAAVPYTILHKIWYRPDIVPVGSWYKYKLTLLWWNFRDLNLITIMPWTVFICLVNLLIYFRRRDETVKPLFRWLVFGLTNVFFTAILSPQTVDKLTFVDARYLIVSVPFLLVSVGIFLYLVSRLNRIFAFLLFLVLITSNVLTLSPISLDVKPTFKWLLPAYIRETHNDFPTAHSVVVKYLSENAAQDELVFSYPDFENYPLIFYLGSKLKFCCTLFSNTPPKVEQKLKECAPYLFMKNGYENYPDWFISFGYLNNSKRFLKVFSAPHIKNRKSEKFEYVRVAIPDVYYFDTSRPELFWHSFGPKTDFDPKVDGVYIFKREQRE